MVFPPPHNLRLQILRRSLPLPQHAQVYFLIMFTLLFNLIIIIIIIYFCYYATPTQNKQPTNRRIYSLPSLLPFLIPIDPLLRMECYINYGRTGYKVVGKGRRQWRMGYIEDGAEKKRVMRLIAHDSGRQKGTNRGRPTVHHLTSSVFLRGRGLARR